MAWLTDHLDLVDGDLRWAAELLSPDPDTTLEGLAYELGPLFVPALVWLVSAAVAILAGGDITWLDVRDFGSEADRVRRTSEDVVRVE